MVGNIQGYEIGNSYKALARTRLALVLFMDNERIPALSMVQYSFIKFYVKITSTATTPSSYEEVRFA